MESPLELPIFIQYRPSNRVGLFNTLAHAGAIFCLFLTSLPFAVTGLLTTVILIHYGFYVKRHLASEKICFKLDRNDKWQLLQEDREAAPLRLLPGALVHPKLVILCFREPDGRTRACVLTHDNLDRQTLRRLRVRLRWPHN